MGKLHTPNYVSRVDLDIHVITHWKLTCENFIFRNPQTWIFIFTLKSQLPISFYEQTNPSEQLDFLQGWTNLL
jgi:hypothetical protein